MAIGTAAGTSVYPSVRLSIWVPYAGRRGVMALIAEHIAESPKCVIRCGVDEILSALITLGVTSDEPLNIVFHHYPNNITKPGLRFLP